MTQYRDKTDTDRCYFCPRQTDIEAHHIVPQRFDGKDVKVNLVALCERCHKKIEALYDKRFYERLGLNDETGERMVHFECYRHDCTERAEVKLAHLEGGVTIWNCLDCAKEKLKEGGKRGKVKPLESYCDVDVDTLNDLRDPMKRLRGEVGPIND